jgi:hypothetical protein
VVKDSYFVMKRGSPQSGCEGDDMTIIYYNAMDYVFRSGYSIQRTCIYMKFRCVHRVRGVPMRPRFEEACKRYLGKNGEYIRRLMLMAEFDFGTFDE